MPQTISFDFTCTELTPALRLPVSGGVTSLHTEMKIEAREDPPGGIVGFFALRGDNASKRKNKPRRPGLVMLEQGEREQIKLVSDPDVMIGGFPLTSPGVHNISLDWEGNTGISTVRNGFGGIVSNSHKPGPIVGEKGITDGMVIIGGDPMPGGKVDYIPPYNWRFTGTIAVDRGDVEEPERQNTVIKPPEIILPPNPPKVPLPEPISVPEPMPTPILVPINHTPIPSPPVPLPPISPSPSPIILPPPSSSKSSPDWSAFPSVIAALSQFYPPLAENLSQLMPYIQALNAGMELADDGFDLSDPSDLVAVFQLISLFKGLKGAR